MVKTNQRTLLLGPDRCGKSCLAKRLYADLLKQGDAPLLVDGSALKNWSADRLTPFLEARVREQYQSLDPVSFWQLDRAKMVLILDDLHQGPGDPSRRVELINELHKKFDRVVIISSDVTLQRSERTFSGRGGKVPVVA
jgi:GTPase SAR1 family protein